MPTVIWVLSAVAVWTAVLTFSYRRSDPQLRTKGLLFGLIWLMLIAPNVYYQMGGDLRTTAWTAIAGAGLFLYVSRGHLESALPGYQDDEEDEAPPWGRINWTLVVVAALIVGLFALTYLPWP